MKKITLLAVSAMFAMSAFSQNNIGNLTVNRTFELAKMAKAASDFNVMMETPAGEMKRYARSADGAGFYLYTGDDGKTKIGAKKQSGSIKIVSDADGQTVYIKGIISQLPDVGWVKGTRNGNTITVETGQDLLYLKNYDCSLKLSMMNINSEGTKFEKDDAVKNVTLTIDGGNITLNGTSEQTILGCYYSDDDTWTGYGDWNSSFSEIEEVAVTPESGVYMKPYLLTADQIDEKADPVKNTPIKVGINGNDIYVQGLFRNIPEGYVKGVKSGNTVTFAMGQLIGDDNQGVSYYLLGVGEEGLTDVVYTYDESKNTFTQETTYVCLSMSFNDLSLVNAYTTSSFKIEPTAVGSIESNGRTVAAEKFFDMSGREIAAPAKGVYVKNVTYTDGTTKAEKVVVK